MSRSDRAVFRLPGVALIIPFLLFVCVTPLANAGAAFWLALYVFPVGGLVYILLTRTVADGAMIRTTGLLGSRRIAWADLDGLEFHGTRWAIAVGSSGRRVRLPMVRPRDLPRLAQVSGGRLLLGRNAPAEPDTEQAEQVEVEQVDVGQPDSGQADSGPADLEPVGLQPDVQQVPVQQADANRAGAEQADAEQRADSR